MGYPTVFTDHSLFGFQDTSSILTNKVKEGMGRGRELDLIKNIDVEILNKTKQYKTKQNKTI